MINLSNPKELITSIFRRFYSVSQDGNYPLLSLSSPHITDIYRKREGERKKVRVRVKEGEKEGEGEGEGG
jgi:hypothetical protein